MKKLNLGRKISENDDSNYSSEKSDDGNKNGKKEDEEEQQDVGDSLLSDLDLDKVDGKIRFIFRS
jgi:hypothetical protein